MAAATSTMSVAEPQSVANLLWCFGTLVSNHPSHVALERAARGEGPPASKLRTRSMLALLRTAVRRISQDCTEFSAYELAGDDARVCAHLEEAHPRILPIRHDMSSWTGPGSDNPS